MSQDSYCKTIKDLQKYLNDKLDLLATKNCIDELKKIIDKQHDMLQEQKLRIDKLEERIDELEGEKSVSTTVSDALKQELLISEEKLVNALDDNEQYGRRLCLRISGIELDQNESADVCLSKCKEVFTDVKVNIPENCMDRAHRIGKKKVVDGVLSQMMIVRFTTWRHRTEVYRARKNCNKYSIFLDLTTQRLNLLKRARDLVIGDDKVDFVFADVNCRLTVKFKDGSFRFFEELEKLIQE